MKYSVRSPFLSLLLPLSMLALSTAGCAPSDEAKPSEDVATLGPNDTLDPEDPAQGVDPVIEPNTPAPTEDRPYLSVDIASFRGFSSSERAKADKALTLMEKVLNSEEFRNRVLNFTWNKQTHFASTTMSNEEVYAAIMAAKETYTVEANHEVNLNLNLYTPPWYKKWSVVGYTYPNSDQIYTNRYYFSSFTPAQIAGNFTHEWTHKLGFGHDYYSTSKRPYSVPYGIGSIMVELASALL